MLAPRLNTTALELTLACPCRCETCGSDAGTARKDELSTRQWLEVLDALVELGCQRVSLLGGEPVSRRRWDIIAAHVVSLGMQVEMVSSGIGVDRESAELMERIGFSSVTISVDGTRPVHDEQRGVPGCYDQALRAISFLDKAGLRVGVNTQVNRKSLPVLNELGDILEAAGAIGWQLILTLPKGRAKGTSALFVEPQMMPEVYQSIRLLQQRPRLRPFIADNIGYLTRDETSLRTPTFMPERCFPGCVAGLSILGITSNGDVKGCMSLPDTHIEGNVLREPISRIWDDAKRFAYNRRFNKSSLSGACAECEFGTLCRGGCTATALAVHGKANISSHCLRLHVR